MAKSGTGSTHGAVARTWLGLALSPRNDRFPGQYITETGFDPQTLLSLNLNLEGIME
jgi:hypothetical protein